MNLFPTIPISPFLSFRKTLNKDNVSSPHRAANPKNAEYYIQAENDFIFSVVGEEFGFLGCLGVLAVMFVIISRCIKISLTSEDNLGALVAGGVAGMLCFQTFVNVGVATGILPNTGMPFPFMSYGGSAMWVDMICIGIVLSVGMKKPKSMF